MALLPILQKSGLSDEEIRNLIGKIARAEIVCLHGEAIHSYFLDVLKLETGLDPITDYIYYPDETGMDLMHQLKKISNGSLLIENR